MKELEIKVGPDDEEEKFPPETDEVDDVLADEEPEEMVPENPDLPDPEEAGSPYMKTTPTYMVQMDEDFTVETLEGTMEGKAGDYLAKGPKGEYYPIDQEVFEMSYEPYEEEAPEDEVPPEEIPDELPDEIPPEDKEGYESVSESIKTGKLDYIAEDDELVRLLASWTTTKMDRYYAQAEARAMRLCGITRREASTLIEKLLKG